jgi:hypothetical protein
MSAMRNVRAQVAIRGPLAAWVLVAHAYATALPLVLVFVAARHWDYLATVADYPSFLFAAAALLCAGSAFEVSRNAVDRWYIEPGTGSAGEPAFWDFLFSWCITAGQAATVVALAGRSPWMLALAAAAVLAQPWCYFSRRATFAPLSVTGLLAAFAAYRDFGDPVVFLQLLLVALTLYFFVALLRTGAQALHGFTTAAAASGLWFLVLAMGNGAAGTPLSWAFTGGIAGAALLVAAIAWVPLCALAPTPRPAD